MVGRGPDSYSKARMCNDTNMRSLTLVLAIAALASIGCGSDTTTQTSSTPSSTSSTPPTDTTKPPTDTQANNTPPPVETKTSVPETPIATATLGADGVGPNAAPGAKAPKKGDEVAVMTTNKGTIIIKFLPDKAPGTVKNFIMLANQKFYDGTKFHRVIPDFMIQGGDPLSKTDRSRAGTGGAKDMIKHEFSDLKHERGILSMARSQDEDSASSQFFIMVKYNESLDHHYSAFGQVIAGMDVVDKIVNLPRDQNDNPLPDNEAVIKSVRIVKWPIKK